MWIYILFFLNGTVFHKVLQLILISFFQTQSKPRQLQQSPSSLSFVPIDVRKQIEVSFAAKTKQQKIQIRLQIRLSFRTDLCSNEKNVSSIFNIHLSLFTITYWIFAGSHLSFNYCLKIFSWYYFLTGIGNFVLESFLLSFGYNCIVSSKC